MELIALALLGAFLGGILKNRAPAVVPPPPRGEIPGTYDVMFERHRGRIPVEFLRAVAWNESRMNPKLVAKSGARGLMQVVGVVRRDYNDAHNTALTEADLMDPETSIKLAVHTMEQILTAYRGVIVNDWSPGHAELVAAGWNAGYSRSGGVARLAAELVGRDQPITADTIHELAREGYAAPSSRWLAMPKRRRFWAAIRRDYERQLRSGGVS